MTFDLNPSGALGSREDRARALAALADQTRLGVMDLLAYQDLSPDALAAALEVRGNLLAHHLNVLESVGLVTRVHSQHDRRRTYVHAVEGALSGLLPSPQTLTAPRIVFVCTHNSARSVLADALWRTVSDVPSTSAGTEPAAAINLGADKAAARHGLALARTAPVAIADVVKPDDLLVSVCDAVNEQLGAVGNPRIHWSIPDPTVRGTPVAFDEAVRELIVRVTHLAPRVTCTRGSLNRARARR